MVLTSITLFSSVAILNKAELKNGELRLTFNQAYNKSAIRVMTLKNPTRKVFDIKNAKLKSSYVGKNLKSIHCSSIRVSQFKKNTVRVALEVDRSYSCEAYRPMLAYSSYHIPLPKFRSVKKSVYSKKPKKIKKIKKPIKVAHVKDKNKNKNLSFILPSKSSGKNTVVIDAGHGGHDPGAVGGRKREKDLVLQISKRLRKQLIKRGYKVYMTRSDDRFLKLHQRTKIADRKDAMVFISIHANSVPKRKKNRIHGIETYFLSNAKDARSQRIAARENKSVLKGAGSRLSKQVIVDSVLNGPKIVESNKLAVSVQSRIMTNVHTMYKNVKSNGVKHAGFYVLAGASRPSILIEVGYISHPRERKRLFNSKYQELISKGIAEGIDIYLNNRKKEIEL
jgi:N-acetylmuramoyl-L-alanine amidase